MWPLTTEPQSFVTGVLRLSDGTLKVYVGQRGLGIYTLIYDDAAAREVEHAWADQSCHVLIPTPPSSCLYSDADDARVDTSPATEEPT